MRSAAWKVAKLAVTLALLGYFIRAYVDLGAFASLVAKTSMPALLAYAAALLVARWVQAIQTQQALAEAGVAVRPVEVFRSQLIATFYTMFVPGDLVGGGVTWYLLAKSREGGAMIAMILVYLRLVFLATAVPFAIAGILFESRIQSALLSGALGLAALGTAIAIAPLVFRRPAVLAVRLVRALGGLLGEGAARIRAALKTLSGCIETCASASARATASAFGYSVVLHVLGAAGLWLVAEAAHAGVPFHAFLWVWPLMVVVHMLPISFGGLGVREITLVYVLDRLYGTSAESILLLSMITLLATTLLGLFGGLWNSAQAAAPVDRKG